MHALAGLCGRAGICDVSRHAAPTIRSFLPTGTRPMSSRGCLPREPADCDLDRDADSDEAGKASNRKPATDSDLKPAGFRFDVGHLVHAGLGKGGSDPIQPQACLIVLPLGKTGGNVGLPSHTGRRARRNCRRGDVCRCFVQPVAGVHTLLAVARTAGARRRHPGCILVSLGPLRRLGMASLGLLASSLGLAPLGLVPSLLPPLAPLLVGAVGLPLPLVLITRPLRRRRTRSRRRRCRGCGRRGRRR
jgi:hypothetical protein